MKIGIISDIHAQYDSLEKALAILEREQVDKIICAGDLVERGKDGERVVHTIRQMNIPVVRGNHDELAREGQTYPLNQLAPDVIEETFVSLRKGDFIQTDLLTPETLNWLESLPLQLEFNWEGFRIVMFHGTPKSNRSYLTPDMLDEEFEMALSDINADIAIYGHTHEPINRKIGKTLLLNPGGVYKSSYNLSSYTCATLNLSDCNFRVYSLETSKQIELD